MVPYLRNQRDLDQLPSGGNAEQRDVSTPASRGVATPTTIRVRRATRVNGDGNATFKPAVVLLLSAAVIYTRLAVVLAGNVYGLTDGDLVDPISTSKEGDDLGFHMVIA